jgi:hypothetical protein
MHTNVSDIKDKRQFLVCHSKNCRHAKHNERCTISAVPYYGSLEDHAKQYNAIKLCMLYTNPTMLNFISTPNWKLSPQKPGLRKRIHMQKAQQAEEEANPDYLELF